jgi:hypothetical protein
MALALEILVLLAGATALLLLIPSSRPHKRPVRRKRPPQRPADLERVERALVARTAADVHVPLRPLLREIAQPLAWRHGVRLDHDPERACELLGPDLWEIVRPERPRPEDLRAPGLAPEELEQIIARLEEL